jgi:hypothetical protein
MKEWHCLSSSVWGAYTCDILAERYAAMSLAYQTLKEGWGDDFYFQ